MSTSKHHIANAVAAMGQAVTGLTFAIADHEPQYWRVYENQIDSGLRRVREAEAALVEAKFMANKEAAAMAEAK